MESGCDFEAEKMLDLYLHDYMVKRKMFKTAEIFRREADVSAQSVAIDSPDGFLHEWFTTFYDGYSSRQGKDKAPIKAQPMTLDQLQSSMLAIGPHNLVMNQKRPVLQSPPACTDFDKMLGLQATFLSPAMDVQQEHRPICPLMINSDSSLQRLDPNEQNLLKLNGATLSYQEPQITHSPQQYNKNGITIGRFRPMDAPLYEVQNTTYSRSKFSEAAGLNQGINPAPLRWLLLSSFSQAPNHMQHIPLLTEQCQENVQGQALSCTSRAMPSSVPGSSLNSINPNLMLPRNNMDRIFSSNLMLPTSDLNQNESQMMAQTKQTKENRNRHAQSLQQQLLQDQPADDDNVDNGATLFRSLRRSHPSSNENDRKGFCFDEIGCLCSSKGKMLCCDFSSDGKLLATAGHDRKVVIWNMETYDFSCSSETHSFPVTGVRFRPSSTVIATSSFDRTVRIWDAAKPNKSMFKLSGFSRQVISVDFYPRKPDLLCSCDGNDEIQLWNIKLCVCLNVSKLKESTKQVRFQPRNGPLLAIATGNSVKIIDVENDKVPFHLKGHSEEVLCVCWDISGKYIASVSEDRCRVWSLVTGGNCIYELLSNGKKFQSCIFHPGYSQLLIIGTDQPLEFWNPIEDDKTNKTWSVPAHNGLIVALAGSLETEVIASASHDQSVKLWK